MKKRRPLVGGLIAIIGMMLCVGLVARASSPGKSINSTSTNRSTPPSTLVAEQPLQNLPGFRVLAANDLGMHCLNLDQRVVSILPPFNTLHAQVVQTGRTPQLLNNSQVKVVYSAASNPNDPVLASPLPTSVYKTNFWDINPRTGNPYGFDAVNPYYPPGVLSLFPVQPDVGLPVPDLQRLYLGDGTLSADQQQLPSATAPFVTQPYSANDPQAFALYYDTFPFFINFPFGYTLPNINWFSAEGLPLAPFDDLGRMNAYPLMRVQATAASGNTLGLSTGTVLSSLDTVTPVSAEVSCQTCHTSKVDGGNGSATRGKGFTVATQHDDPLYGQVPLAVSIDYAYGLNIVRLHDVKHGTNLEAATPVACQRCHYSPALDLAHVGPKGPGGADANGREQTLHHTMSMAMHGFHASLVNSKGKPVFPLMPSPKGRGLARRDNILQRSCYGCHPGQQTKCFRGVMSDAGLACQDCHGQMAQVGTDFSKNVSPSNPGAFIVAGDFYTNPATPRVPWANEPMCQSCHTGDAVSGLASSANVITSSDGITLLQAYRTNDANSRPIVATNRRFAENQSGSKQVLFRLSTGHGGLFCEGCHGSTHAEWPNATANANDNVAGVEMQGHAGMLMECTSCHGSGSFPINDFVNNFDANGLMKGPHGMHPVADSTWVHQHSRVFEDGRTPSGTCQACHGSKLEGTVLSMLPVDRTLPCDESNSCVNGKIVLKKGTKVSCTLCHENPGSEGGGGD